MKSIIRSTIQNAFASSILIPSLHGDTTLTQTEITSSNTSVIGNPGSSSTSLQNLLEQPPSIFAPIFLLSSFVLFAICVFCLGTIKVEQVDRMEVQIIQSPQTSKLVDVSLLESQQSQTRDKHGLIMSEQTSELDRLLEKINTLTRDLVSIQVHAIATQTLQKTVIPPVPPQSIQEEKEFLYMHNKLPKSINHSFKTGELVQISLQNHRYTDQNSGEIIAIALLGVDCCNLSENERDKSSKICFHRCNRIISDVQLCNSKYRNNRSTH